MSKPRNASELVDALGQAAFVITSTLSRIAAANELSLTQLRVFGVLRDRKPRMAELAEYLGLDKSTMSGLVDRAAKKGLLARSQSREDARAFDVAMTTTGRMYAERIAAQVEDALGPAIDRLTAAEQRQLTSLLAKLLG